MYVIHENDLIHVDTGSDVLEHYGVKGMKWGKRIANSYAGSLAKAHYNSIRHPILAQKAYDSAGSKSYSGRFFVTKRSLDYQNKFVKTQRDANIDYKKKLKDLKKNKYKKADDLNKSVDKKLEKAYDKQEETYNNLKKNSKLKNYLTKEGRKQRSEAKKEYKKADNVAASLEDQMIKNYSNARKQYKQDKKKLKDQRKNATTGLRY